jgi:hypothetical protein
MLTKREKGNDSDEGDNKGAGGGDEYGNEDGGKPNKPKR